MMNTRKWPMLALLLFGAAGCVDLDVQNPNQPGAERALQTAGDVESLIGGGYSQWWNSEWSAGSSLGPILSVQSFQHSAFPANFGMHEYSFFPRVPINNNPAHTFYGQWAWPWTFAYRAIAVSREGLVAIDDGSVTYTAANERRARAFAHFLQGLGHAQLAILFDQAFIVDETTQLLDASGAAIAQEAVPYPQVLAAAMGYFDKAIALAAQGGFTIPASWTSREIPAAELVRLAHSYKARYRAAAARDWAERQNVNWDAVMDDVDKGITATWHMRITNTPAWGAFGIGWYVNTGGGLWAQMSHFILGMADQSGRYQRWLDFPVMARHPNLGGDANDPMIIVTPDTRFPQGETLAAQQTSPGSYYRASTTTGMWGQPGRGTWRWSWYVPNRNTDWFASFADAPDYPWVPLAEMRLLKAEGHFHKGELGAAAAIINETREAAGLNATNAAGTNTSCVPKLPNGECGDLFEMLKWEKRLENVGYGLLGAPWYFDGRGWGDLYRGTQLEFPMPCREAQVLFLECYTFGGVGGVRASTGSSYQFPFEM
jgi:starch-binding outer membrane protein, SusD/RagB family